MCLKIGSRSGGLISEADDEIWDANGIADSTTRADNQNAAEVLECVSS